MYSLILHGRKSLELQKWRPLRFAVNIFRSESAFSVNPSSPNALSYLSNSFSSASAAAADVSLEDGRKGQKFTVSYLVDSLGFTTKVAESIWRKVSSEAKGNPDSVLSLLMSHGFIDSQISTIVKDYPQVLVADAEKSLARKLQSLQSRGASSSELTEILSKVPKILGMKGDKTISRYYDLAKAIIEADKSSKFKTLCHSSLPQGSRQGNIIRNVSLLRELGVPQKLLFSFLVSNFRTVCGREKFEDTIKKVVGMGFDPTTSKFVQALHCVYQMSDKTIEEKTNAYKRLGFEVEDVWALFKKWPFFMALSEKKIADSSETYLGLGFTQDEFTLIVKRLPQCIGLSAETVKKKTEFLVKQMGWSLKAVVSHPQVLGYSMEKRIVPRCNVIKALLSKGLLGSEVPPMTSVLTCTNKVFLERYVTKHDDKELVAKLMHTLSNSQQKPYEKG